jgi:transporter
MYNKFKEGMIMIKIFNTNEETLELMQIRELRVGSWISVIKPDSNDISNLSNMLGIDVSFIPNILVDEEQSRIDSIPDKNIKMLLVDIPIKENKNSIKAIPLLILFIGNDYIVTVSEEDSEVLKTFKMGLVKDFSTHKRSRFMIQILYRTATMYFKYLRNINKQIEKVGNKLLNATNNKDLINMLSIEKKPIYIMTSLKSNEIVLEKILKGNFIDFYEEDRDLLEDAITENRRCMEMADLYREILSSMTDSYATIISNNLNNMMKFLAGITIVFSIPTMVASFMGMNVPLGDMATHPYAFFLLIVLSLFLSLLVAIYLKRKNML